MGSHLNNTQTDIAEGTQQALSDVSNADTMQPTERVKWVYSATSPNELAKRYDEWARTYESDLTNHFGRPDREPIADLLADRVPTTGCILDAGVGTGVAGVWLAEMGYRDITGFDNSAAMLELAQKKKVYRRLEQLTLGEPLSFPSASFDATIAVGVFTHGHVPVSAMDELIRVTRSGGHILFTMLIDFYDQSDIRTALQNFVDKGLWQPEVVGEPYGNQVQSDDDHVILLRTHCYRVL